MSDKDYMEAIARAICNLGNGNASTHLGAIEALSMELRDGSDRIADALNNVAAAIRETIDK